MSDFLTGIIGEMRTPDYPTEEEYHLAEHIRVSYPKIRWGEMLQSRFVGIPHPTEAFPDKFNLSVKVGPYHIYAPHDVGMITQTMLGYDLNIEWVFEMLSKAIGLEVQWTLLI